MVRVGVEPPTFRFQVNHSKRCAVLGIQLAYAKRNLNRRDAHRVLHHPDTQRLLDLTRPVAVLIVSVPHFLMDDTATAELVSAYREHTVPGSYLAISHMTGDHDPHIRDLQRLYQHTSMPFRTRAPDQITALFHGYELAPPGVVGVSDWHPDPGPDPNRATRDAFLSALGRRPHRRA